ncbi:MAG: hypothetical protein IPK82_31580 [Polyangiaceae bacterium]|nr:hypothetical protein [Polyangiaceae bacterium]
MKRTGGILGILAYSTALLAFSTLTGCVDDKLVGGKGGSGGTGGAGGQTSSTGGSTGTAGQGGMGTTSGTGGSGATGGGSTSSTGGSTSGTGGTGGMPPMLDGWARQFGDDTRQEVTDVGVDSNGNIVMVGLMRGTFAMDGATLVANSIPNKPPTDSDIFVAKLDPTGAVLWAKNFGNGTPQDCYGVAVDGAGNIAVIGGFRLTIDFGGGGLTSTGSEQDLFIVKFDGSGNHLWSKRFGDTAMQPGYLGGEIAFDNAGNVIAAGDFRGSMDLGGGPLTTAGQYDSDLFLAKFDPNGNHIYSKRFGDAESMGQWGEELNDLTVDVNGNAVISGSYEGTVNFGGGALTTSNGGFLAKFDGQGNHVWSKVFGQFGAQITTHTIGPQGEIYLAANFNDVVDFGGGQVVENNGTKVIVRLDSAGNHVWTKQYKGPGFVNDMAASPSGNVTFVGSAPDVFDLTGLGGPTLDSFGLLTNGAIVTVDQNGSFVTAKLYGPPSALNSPERRFEGVAYDSSGYLVVGGSFNATIDMGFGLMVTADKPDMLIAKLPQVLP